MDGQDLSEQIRRQHFEKLNEDLFHGFGACERSCVVSLFVVLRCCLDGFFKWLICL